MEGLVERKRKRGLLVWMERFIEKKSDMDLSSISNHTVEVRNQLPNMSFLTSNSQVSEKNSQFDVGPRRLFQIFHEILKNRNLTVLEAFKNFIEQYPEFDSGNSTLDEFEL